MIDLEDILRYKVQIILVLLILIVCFFTLIQLKKQADLGQTKFYTSILLVEKDGVEYELKIRNEDQTTIYREGEKEEIVTKIKRVGKERLALPNFNEIKAENTLKGKLQKSDFSVDLTYTDSFKYVKYLLETEGYSISMYASTPQYVEIFLIKDNLYKRLIIFLDTIMIGDMYETVNLPSVDAYFKQYNLNELNKNNNNGNESEEGINE